MGRVVAVLLAALMLHGSGCGVGPAARRGSGADPEPSPPGPSAPEVAEILAGEFSSRAQAASDKDYFAIHLRHVPIWTSRDDGPWLYVEQAAEAMLDKPYRQRIYQLRHIEDRVRSDIYAIPEPARFVGADPETFAGLTPADLILREGCSILLERIADGHYEGATVGRGCSSRLGDASYATSEVDLRTAVLETWDRGFSDGGVQVWGAVKGPYLFEREDPTRLDEAEPR